MKGSGHWPLSMVALWLLPLACAQAGDGDADYLASVRQWHAERDASLRKPDGWLSFIGSGVVAAGRHRVGATADNDIVLAVGPERLGTLSLDGDGILSFQAEPDADARIDGEPFDVAILKTQRDEGGPTHVHLGRAWLYVVRLADGSTGWRLRDPQSPALLGFQGIEHFPIQERWRIRADWQPLEPPETLDLVTSAGTPDVGTVTGLASFEQEGRSFTLRPIAETDGRLFFVFADRTSGRDTYGAARFLYADAPEDGVVILDFNKAYNPPCALTPHVVCPLAPPENRLPLAVTAGEKKPAGDLHSP